MTIEDFVFIIFEKDYEVPSTYVVLKEKLDDFVNDKYAMFGIGNAHIFKAIMCFNGSIGKGDYIKSINIFH